MQLGTETSPKWMTCSKDNVTKLPKNCKILTELLGRRQEEVSGFLSFWFSWDHWHAMRRFLWPLLWITVLNKRSFSTAWIMNHSMCWKGPQIPSSSISLPWAGTLSTRQVLKTLSNLALNTSAHKKEIHSFSGQNHTGFCYLHNSYAFIMTPVFTTLHFQNT